ncbi:hypothetical protein G7Y79_00025g058150 [Physcia stellaris]|nr:hypothetical protein G7Y79_00025g058150 [Physcia stellaris]
MRLCERNNKIAIPEDATLNSLFKQLNESLAALVGHVGKHSFVRPPFYCFMGCNIWLGDDVSINDNFQCRDLGLVTIKDRTMIGPCCRITTLNHSLNYLERRRPDGAAKPVEIGEDCWLGIGVTVLPGVTIGKGCVVAAGAVVAKDVAPFNLVGGVPAKVIRYLGNPEEVDEQDQSQQDSAKSSEDGVEEGEKRDYILEGKTGESELPNGSGTREMDESEADLPRWLRKPHGVE